MRYFIPNILLIIFSLFINANLNAQDLPVINEPRLNFANNKLQIDYDIIGRDKENKFRVNLEVKSTEGEIINVRALSGDVGLLNEGGKNKTIIWDLEKDSVYLDEEISVTVIAEVIPATPSRAGLIGLSIIYPGLGQKKFHKKNAFLLIGTAGYACITGSVILNRTAGNNYENYLESTDIRESENYFDMANKQNKISKYLAYTAAGIWIADILWIMLRPKREILNGYTDSTGEWSVRPGLSETYKPMITFYLEF
ncbi:MAG: hypothetical protein K9J25_05820 [Bacteroidales bacterium]|nr:hypothetical protein [Bacteroidales bacterium]